jgi:hypothetical protein
MPVPVRSGQSRHLHPEHQPDTAEANFGHQALKAEPVARQLGWPVSDSRMAGRCARLRWLG